MKIPRFIIIALFLLIPGGIFAQEKTIPVLGFSDFERLLHQKSDTVYVINFWATWCGPCRRELPEFEKIHQDYALEKVKVLLVSLDFPSRLESGLNPYLESNRITAPVVLLNEPDANAWIDKVDPVWTGSLPATLIYKRSNRLFYERELHYQDIYGSIQSLINL
jgi:thiol-disulfide isomerase/thioredoxin